MSLGSTTLTFRSVAPRHVASLRCSAYTTACTADCAQATLA
jgi:hypothetical protein